MSDRPIDFNALWGLARQVFGLGPQSFHGPAHWRRVEQNGLWLAERTGADIDLVRLFAILHDTQRWDEGEDPDHGYRAAEYVQELHGKAFHLDEARLAQLTEAVKLHADGFVSRDPTIGTCWDADRLDLPRVGIWPTTDLLSTSAAGELLEQMERAGPHGRG